MATPPRVRVQPYNHRFGNDFRAELLAGTWTSLDVAVAWVRRSGTQHIVPALEAFLAAGNAVRLSVGIDIQHTSEEGLRALLGLSAIGDAETRVYHNEAKGNRSTFHPKVYLFRNGKDARLFLGSNNLTGGGLFSNVEHHPREIRYPPPRHPSVFPVTLKQHLAVPFVVRLLTPEYP